MVEHQVHTGVKSGPAKPSRKHDVSVFIRFYWHNNCYGPACRMCVCTPVFTMFYTLLILSLRLWSQTWKSESKVIVSSVDPNTTAAKPCGQVMSSSVPSDIESVGALFQLCIA